MVSLLEPRNETEFIYELKGDFLKANPHKSYFSRITGMAGEPDVKFGRVDKAGKRYEFYMEAKYVKHPLSSLKQMWRLLRGIQQVTFRKMAAAGFNVYLVVCINGKEALWYYFDRRRSLESLMGKAAPWTCVYLKYISYRNNMGKWIMGEPNDPKATA